MNGRKKVFVSFDYDHDKALKDLIIAQSHLQDSPFNVADMSLQEPKKARNWKKRAEARISAADMLLVILGPETHRAPGVLNEVSMANKWRVPRAQVICRDKTYKRVPRAGKVYRWTWGNLKKLFGSSSIRGRKPSTWARKVSS